MVESYRALQEYLPLVQRSANFVEPNVHHDANPARAFIRF